MKQLVALVMIAFLVPATAAMAPWPPASLGGAEDKN
jgi:hypothetical protein